MRYIRILALENINLINKSSKKREIAKIKELANNEMILQRDQARQAAKFKSTAEALVQQVLQHQRRLLMFAQFQWHQHQSCLKA